MELLKLFDSIAKSIIYRSWQKNPAYYQSLSMTKKDLEQEIFIHFQRSYNKYHEKKFGKELENILAQTVINRLDRTRLESVIKNKNIDFNINDLEEFLDEQEFFIIDQKFCNHRSLTEIGKELGFTPQRASQLYKQAILKIKK